MHASGMRPAAPELARDMSTPIKIDIWSDIACPWCYIGKRRFEKALSEYEHKDAVEITWRSYELQPGGPQGSPQSAVEHLMAKYGRSREQVLEMLNAATQAAAGEGLAYNLPESKMTSTFDAHRLTKLAQEHGVLAEVMEGLMHATGSSISAMYSKL